MEILIENELILNGVKTEDLGHFINDIEMVGFSDYGYKTQNWYKINENESYVLVYFKKENLCNLFKQKKKVCVD